MLHPGPVRLVRRGSRKDVVAITPVRTRVELREADPRDVPEVGQLNYDGSYHVYHEHGGALWLRPKGLRFGKLPAPSDADTILAFLEGRLPAATYAHTDYVRALAGSPVLGALVRDVRAEDGDALDAARDILDDAREEAVAAARRWAEERILVAGGSVYLRAPNPMAVLGDRQAYASLQRCLVDPYPAYWRTCRYRKPDIDELAMELNGYPVRLDRLGDTQEAVQGMGLIGDPAGQRSAASAQARKIPGGLLDDDDIVLMANVLPGHVLAEMERRRRAGGPGPDEAALRDLRALEVRGAAGLIGIDSAESAIARAAGVARGQPGARFEAVALWSDAIALPRLRSRPAAEPPPEDQESLAGLKA